MSFILIAEQDASGARLIANTLQSAGWQVETVDSRAAALRSAATSKPGLLLVNAEFPEAAQLLAAFSRNRGGPGSLVLVPASVTDRATVEDLGGDEAIAMPCSGDVLQQTVRHCLEKARQVAPESSLPKRSTQQLTSADIFGDVLAEVEAEAERSRKARRVRAKASRTQKEDLERRLEETLSGVLSVDEMRKRSRGPRPASPASRDRAGPGANAEVEALLGRTLSALDMSPRAEPPPRSSQVSEPHPPKPPPEAAPSVIPAAAVRETPPTPEPAADVPALPEPGTAMPESEAPEMPPLQSPPPGLHPPAEGSSPGQVDLANLASSVAESRGADLGIESFKTQALPIVTAGDAAPDTEGVAFGDYTLLDRVAIGGMAEVWRARRRGVEGFQKTVAIKKILAHLTTSPDFVKMFIDEAKLAAQLNHHNIIQIYDLGKVDEDFFIAMEYVEGKDLRSILTAAKERDRPVPIRLSLLIVSAVARALDYAHRKRDFDDRDLGLVHRDVSPQNVLISYEGEIKLCDFGIVKAVSKTSTTQMGALKGKLQYMSPEQAWGKTVDARSDIFSLGSVFFELLTGDKLFSGDNEISVLDAVRDCRPPSPREIVPEIPPEIESIVLKALAKDPEQRYQTAGDLEHGIQSVLEHLSPTPGLKDLASYLENLFQSWSPGSEEPAASYSPQRFEAPPAAHPQDEVPAEAPPEVAEIPVSPATSRSAETGKSPRPGKSAGGGKGLRRLLAAAILAGMLAAVGFLAMRGSKRGGEDANPTAPPQSSSPRVPAGEDPAMAEGEPAPAAATDDPTAVAESEAGEEGPADTDLADTGLEDTSPAAAAPATDLEQLVESAVSKKREQIKEELERDFEAQKRRLEEEIAKTREAGQPPPGEGEPEGGGGDES